MSDEPKTKTSGELGAPGAFDAPDAEPTDRPTVAPPFDVASYARTTAAEGQEGVKPDGEEPDSERPTVAPPFDVAAFAKESFDASNALHGADDAAAARGSRPPTVQVSPILDLRQRFTAGDYAGALAVAEAVLAKDPGSAEARTCAADCREKMLAKSAAQVGPLDRVPEVVVGHDQLRALHIDHRAGFLLSLVDGVSSFELILDICGMARPDAMRILGELVQERIVSIQAR